MCLFMSLNVILLQYYEILFYGYFVKIVILLIFKDIVDMVRFGGYFNSILLLLFFFICIVIYGRVFELEVLNGYSCIVIIIKLMLF